MHSTPQTLLERLQRPGDEAAWERFVELYTPLLFSWVRRCGENEHDAADLIQEVFVVLLQTLPSFQYDPKGRFRSWLRTLLLNKLRDHRRRRVRAERAMAQTPGEEEEPDAAEQFWEVEFRAELARRALEIMQANFNPSTWQAVWQTVVEGQSPADVARRLGLTENAVYLARFRVLHRLRQELRGLVD
jgi:RNA polymerase sigma-70 factor (ECF subfamily)